MLQVFRKFIPSPAMIIALIALFVALGGTAAALTGSNTVFSDDIVDGQVYSADVRNDTLAGGGLGSVDLRAGSVGTSEVRDDSVTGGGLAASDLHADSVASSEVAYNSLTGADVDESTLGLVPSARLGGIGSWESKSGEGCDVGGDFFTCAFTNIDLPRNTRVLLIGTAKAQVPPYKPESTGHCLLATQSSNLTDSVTGFDIPSGDEEHIALIATTFVYQGPVDFAIRCRQLSGDIQIYDAAIAAVALSP